MTPDPHRIVRRYATPAYPGWTIRRFEDGTYDAQRTHSAPSARCDSFTEALLAIKRTAAAERMTGASRRGEAQYRRMAA